MADFEENDLFEEEGVKIENHESEENSDKDELLIDQIKITVSDPEKKTKVSGLKIQDTFICYLIEATPKKSNSSLEVSSIWRRYSEFELLRNYLVAFYPAVVVPPIPEKRANYIWRKLDIIESIDLEFLEKRRFGLESFLHRVASHHKMGKDIILKDFITKEEGWKDSVSATDYQAKSDSWFKNMNATFRVKQSDIRMDQLKVYANQLQTLTAALLKLRAKVAERVYGIYKIHGNYSRVLSEWALIEDEEKKKALQKSSVYISALAKSIDNLIDEEDQIAEQIKEYMYFSDALKLVIQKHQALQYEVELCEQQLATSLSEKRQLESGTQKSFSFGSMKAKLLGIDPQVQKELRLEQLEIDIAVFEGELENAKSSAKNFLEEALLEVDLFQKNKISDLKEIFTSYVVLQIKINREGIEIWERFQKSLAPIKSLKSSS